MTTIPEKPFSLTFPPQLIALIAGLATASCAIESASAPSALPLPALELAADTAIEPGEPLEPRPSLGNIDLSYWDYRTSLPDSELLMFEDGFFCGLIYPEAVPPGQWVLVGISEVQRYTPILDIYRDQTGNRTKNDTVYYHFQLVDSK